jgi:hypothetical protein
MPRIQVVKEHRIPVSIPAKPICPRCLDIEPGTPMDPNERFPGPYTGEFCLPCGRAVQSERANSAFGGFPPCACGRGTGCFTGGICIECYRDAVRKEKNETGLTVRVAPYAVAVRPMQVHPRPGYDGPVDGPLRMAHGPRDFDGLGRERFWDQSPEERAATLPAMVEDAGRQLDRIDPKYWKVQNENRIFARGWLNELDRTKDYRKQPGKK